MLSICGWMLMMAAAPAAVGAMDLSLVRAEPKLEKRSELALLNAVESIEEARKAYDGANLKSFQLSMTELLESVELSYRSLQDTGKAARRSPKYFKRCELKLRDLVRRLQGVEQIVELEERAGVEKITRRVSEIQEQVLLDIMTKKN